MKKIILITTSFPNPDYASGQEAAGLFVYDFAHSLANDGLKIEVIAPAHKEEWIEDDPITIHYFKVPSLPLSLLKPIQPQSWPKIIQTLKAGQRAVQNAIKKEKADHILALWALPSGYWAMQSGLPYSIWALGSDIWQLKKLPFIRSYLKKVLIKAQYRFADGYGLAREVEQISGQSCYFLPSSRQLPDLGTKKIKTAPPYNLAFLGRWHKNKGIDLLLDALSYLDEKDWQLIEQIKIYGGGPLEKLVHEGVAHLKQSGRPIELGSYLNRQQAAELLFWADYLLLPSRIESIPVIFSDAMQMHCPIICNPVGDLPRLIDDYQVGVLAKKANANEFAKAIKIALHKKLIDFNHHIEKAKQDFSLPGKNIQLIIK